jgi:tetratricopeptide (TPR) repeat protein
MSGQSKSDRRVSASAEAFEEHIDVLFEELSFAIQWQRPSILLVFYESETERKQAEYALEKRLAEIGQKVVRVKVKEKHFDIPLMLSRRKNRDQTVFSTIGLASGGGKAGANAYRALNIRREFFVDYSIRVILWLTGEEAIALSRHAPDFWAFRHRVVELNQAGEPVDRTRSIIDVSESDQGFPAQSESLDRQIEQHEALLIELPRKAEAYPKRLDLLVALAGLYRAKQAYDPSTRRAKQGILIARKINNIPLLAKLWSNLGDVYADQDQQTRAIRAYRKALRLSPEDASVWSKLGHFYHIKKRFRDAIIAYKQVLRLDPRNSPAKSSLAECYRLLGKEQPAEK